MSVYSIRTSVMPPVTPEQQKIKCLESRIQYLEMRDDQREEMIRKVADQLDLVLDENARFREALDVYSAKLEKFETLLEQSKEKRSIFDFASEFESGEVNEHNNVQPIGDQQQKLSESSASLESAIHDEQEKSDVQEEVQEEINKPDEVGFTFGAHKSVFADEDGVSSVEAQVHVLQKSPSVSDESIQNLLEEGEIRSHNENWSHDENTVHLSSSSKNASEAMKKSTSSEESVTIIDVVPQQVNGRAMNETFHSVRPSNVQSETSTDNDSESKVSFHKLAVSCFGEGASNPVHVNGTLKFTKTEKGYEMVMKDTESGAEYHYWLKQSPRIQKMKCSEGFMWKCYDSEDCFSPSKFGSASFSSPSDFQKFSNFFSLSSHC